MVKKKRREGTCGECPATQSVTWYNSKTKPGTKLCDTCYNKERKKLAKSRTDIKCTKCSSKRSNVWHNVKTMSGKKICDKCYRKERYHKRRVVRTKSITDKKCAICSSTQTRIWYDSKTSPGTKLCKKCYYVERATLLFRYCVECGHEKSYEVVCVKHKTLDGRKGFACRPCVERKCVVCQAEGNRSTISVAFQGGYACPSCVADRKCVVCQAEGNRSTISVAFQGGYACPSCVADRKCVVCQAEGNRSMISVAFQGGYACPSCVFRTCSICDKRGNYDQVCRLHPDGDGHCHNTYSCYGLHKFADPRGCGLCGGLVYEIQKTPEQVLEIVRSRGTEAGYNRGIANGSIVKLDRPVCAECMDDEILEKAETLENEISIERFKSLPEDVQSARVKALLACFDKLNLSMSPPSTLDLSFESDCEESERY